MSRPQILLLTFAVAAALFLGYRRMAIAGQANTAANITPIPAPLQDEPHAQHPGHETAVFAGGCFWGTQSVFQRVKGVTATEEATQAAPPPPRPTTR